MLFRSAAGVAGHPVTTHPFKIRLSQILGGKQPFLRGDEKKYFDPVDESSRAEGGVYYEPDELNRIVGRKGALSAMHGADVSEIKHDIWLAQGLAVRMRDDGKSPKQIFDETGWQLGADGKWRSEELPKKSKGPVLLRRALGQSVFFFKADQLSCKCSCLTTVFAISPMAVRRSAIKRKDTFRLKKSAM